MSIKVFTKKDCVWCDRAKAILKARNVPYKEFVANEDVSVEWIKTAYPQMRTFPIIVMDEIVIGGYTELLEKVSSNPDFGKLLIIE